jgi:hypothetical protein
MLKMYRKEKDISFQIFLKYTISQHIAAFDFVAPVLGEKFTTAEF